MGAPPDPPFKAVGDALRHARESAGLTQSEAAERLSTTQSQIHRYESGKREAPLSFMRRAESVFQQAIVAQLQRPHGVPRETRSAISEKPPLPYGASRERLRGQQEAFTALIRWAVDQQVQVGDHLRALEQPEQDGKA